MSSRLSRHLCLQDFEATARRRLPRAVFDYIRGGAEEGASLKANRRQFDAWGFRPAALVDTHGRHTRNQVLGDTWSLPLGIAPMGACGLASFRADLAMAAAAAKANIPYVLSGASLLPLERILAINPDTWFQAYLPPEPEAVSALLRRAEVAGCRTLVITADVPVLGYREADIRNGFASPLRPSWRLAWDGLSHPAWLLGTFLHTLWREGMPHFENFGGGRGAPLLSRHAPPRRHQRDRLDWEGVARLRDAWPHRLILKGLLDPEDGRRAAGQGIDAAWISNHGGRQLDGAVAPLTVLREFAAAAPALPLLCDGGVRRGTDILKAMGLGAGQVFIGRPFLYAAVAGGEAGVLHAIELLRAELDRDLALLGCRQMGEVAARLIPT